MITVCVQHADFDAGAESRALTEASGDIGAVASFIGLVRADNDITAMTLEHYPGMTQAMLTAIAEDARHRWPLAAVTLIHRVGRLIPGDQIVLVLVASRHRAAALEAVAFLIDWLKVKAPFWKREEKADGQSHWVEARTADSAAAARWNSAP